MLNLFFNRQRWWSTLLAFAAVIVMMGLGFWQLDRLQQRRAFNERVAAQIHAAPLVLDANRIKQNDLTQMEYHAVIVVGQYDFTQEVALRNQAYKDQVGVNLLTPLVISGTNQAVLVNRGWIPFEFSAPDKWAQFNTPGIVEVRGIIRYSQSKPDFGGINDPTGKLSVWNLVNLERIQQQMPYPLVPVYVQQTPSGTAKIGEGTPYTVVNVPTNSKTKQMTLPAFDEVRVDLTDGSNLIYAIQWFIFALFVAIGYARIVWQRAHKERR